MSCCCFKVAQVPHAAGPSAADASKPLGSAASRALPSSTSSLASLLTPSSLGSTGGSAASAETRAQLHTCRQLLLHARGRGHSRTHGHSCCFAGRQDWSHDSCWSIMWRKSSHAPWINPCMRARRRGGCGEQLELEGGAAARAGHAQRAVGPAVARRPSRPARSLPQHGDATANM